MAGRTRVDHSVLPVGGNGERKEGGREVVRREEREAGRDGGRKGGR